MGNFSSPTHLHVKRGESSESKIIINNDCRAVVNDTKNTLCHWMSIILASERFHCSVTCEITACVSLLKFLYLCVYLEINGCQVKWEEQEERCTKQCKEKERTEQNRTEQCSGISDSLIHQNSSNKVTRERETGSINAKMQWITSKSKQVDE